MGNRPHSLVLALRLPFEVFSPRAPDPRPSSRPLRRPTPFEVRMQMVQLYQAQGLAEGASQPPKGGEGKRLFPILGPRKIPPSLYVFFPGTTGLSAFVSGMSISLLPLPAMQWEGLPGVASGSARPALVATWPPKARPSPHGPVSKAPGPEAFQDLLVPESGPILLRDDPELV